MGNLNNNLFTPLEITYKHKGKMEGMQSLSTSCKNNPTCLARCDVEGSICQKCYAQTYLTMRRTLDEKCERNTELLTEGLIPMDQLPYINARVFRFEAFGDIHNTTHLQNYVNIARKNPLVTFTLWTKNIPAALDYFKDNCCPNNFILILSSMFVNQPESGLVIEAFRKLLPAGNLKVFTVYDYEYLTQHLDVTINCGGRKCLRCLRCYTVAKADDIYVNEVLKADATKWHKYCEAHASSEPRCKQYLAAIKQ